MKRLLISATMALSMILGMSNMTVQAKTTLAEVAQKNEQAGQEFLKNNATKEGVKTTESGLQYKVIKEGTGKKPSATSHVKVMYKGYTIDGKVFDASQEPISFPLNAVIPGWTEGLQLMQEGAVYQLFIPANLGYGMRGVGGLIEPNSTLIFDVELISVL